jgi:allophanate hydrolase
LFALNADDAWTALTAIAGIDGADPFTRPLPLGMPGEIPPHMRIAVPRAADRVFFGDKRAKASYDAALKLIATLGMDIVEIDFAPFLEMAKSLYEGPWVAERYAAVGEFIDRHPKKIHPITRKIITGAKKSTAVDAFRAFYRLAELRGETREALSHIDALMVPTAPAAYTVAQVKADPIRLNSNLGTYTNFVNLLDLAGLSVPAAIASDGTPFGVTFLAPAGHDALLASIGRRFHADTGLTLGALNVPQPDLAELSAGPGVDEIALAVVGAHLSGMPLNGELKNLGARFLEVTATAPDYRLFALTDATPHKPGLLRVSKSTGASIEVEIWALPVEAFGPFIAAVPPPLSIGTLTLSDGRTVKGFMVEAEATSGARDISAFGGWRSFTAKEKLRA